METPHKGYSLPYKNNDVVEDVEKISENFIKIDENISNIEENVDTLTTRFLEIIPFIANVEMKVIQNIKAGYYLKTAQDEITCEEGGEDAGGRRFDILEKLSSEDFDTAWTPSASINKENLCTFQALSSVESFVNESYIFKDAIENKNDDEDKATRENFGIIKPGPSIGIEDGIISASQHKKATKEEAGVVMIGNGIELENDAIKLEKRPHATHETFGMVKLNHEFGFKDGATHMIKEGEKILYQLGDIKTVEFGHVNLDLECAHYRAFVNEDLLFSISLDFVQEKDLSFVLEIISDGAHLISFSNPIKPISQTLPINSGLTRIYFTKKLGIPYYEATVSKVKSQEPQLLTPRRGVINSNFILSVPEGCSHHPHHLLREAYTSVYTCPVIRFEFFDLVSVDYVGYWSRSSSASIPEFVFKGSNDGKNWTTLIYKTNEIVYGKIKTEKGGYFRYYELIPKYTSDDNKPGGVSLYGTKIDNNETSIKTLTYPMSSVSTSFCKLTVSAWGSTTTPSHLQDGDVDSCVSVISDDQNQRWIKYEFQTPSVANIIQMDIRTSYQEENAVWFKLEGSNDDETWTLLCERQYETWRIINGRYNILTEKFNNETAYKFYRLVCMATGSTSPTWLCAGFRLYQKADSREEFFNFVPKMTSDSQGGYETSASSRYDSGHAAFCAFDGDSNTKWASKGTGESWLQIKFPDTVIATAFRLISRSDGYTDQAPRDFKIQGSVDGVSWTNILEIGGFVWSDTGQVLLLDASHNTQSYQYYRLLITANNGGGDFSLGDFEIGSLKKEFKRLLNKYDYLVPILNSANENGFIVTCSSQYNTTSEAAYRLFDRSENQWTTKERNPSNQWVKIELPTPAICTHFSLKSSDASSRIPKNFAIQGSHDGSTWIDIIHKENFSWGRLATQMFENPEQTTAYKHYRLYVYANNGDGSFTSLRRFDLLNHSVEMEY